MLHLGWSQAFEDSLSSQGHPQLTSSEDHFPSCSWGPTLYLCFFLLFSFLSIAISCYLFCSYIPLYITLSYFQLWTLRDRRLSCLRISWDHLLSLVFDQDANFPFLLVCLFLLATLCSMQVLSSPTGMNPVWTLYSLRGKGRILTTGPPKKCLIQINVSRHVTPAHTPYNPIIALPSRLVYI